MPGQYDLYRGSPSVWDLDYATSIGTVAEGNASITSDALAWGTNKTWWLGLRATSATAKQEKNTDVVARIETDANGDLVVSLPNLIFGLYATVSGDDVTLYWGYDSTNETIAPTDFRVYRGTSPGSLSAIGTTTYTAGRPYFSYADANLANGTYYYNVRPRNAGGDEVTVSQTICVIVNDDTPNSVPDLLVV